MELGRYRLLNFDTKVFLQYHHLLQYMNSTTEIIADICFYSDGPKIPDQRVNRPVNLGQDNSI